MGGHRDLATASNYLDSIFVVTLNLSQNQVIVVTHRPRHAARTSNVATHRHFPGLQSRHPEHENRTEIIPQRSLVERPVCSRTLDMPPLLPRSRCVSSILASRPSTSSLCNRSYATTVSDSQKSPTARRSPTKFSDRLNAGPSLAEFAGGKEAPISPEEALELKTVMVGPPGRQRKVTRLPAWLKTPIPDGENFKKIKKDLRGLNLHTGMAIEADQSEENCWDALLSTTKHLY
jgi:hypothetical protein